MLQSVQDVILVELSTLEQDGYIIDAEEEFEYKDEEGEWYAITGLKKIKGVWYMEYDYSYFTTFKKIPIELQCELLDYINEKYEDN